ncbi:DNA translocase FtsK [Spiroplasma diminutum]|uniref:DNA translocase n=1 Tax=Spiroplasma diminutum CUAS-1 TaxID=1276221 RepID=S5MIZ5_9MOLU|nr:DNA translocase FtsK [Spiroplasma diminutum]AGR41915.1 DNA translocase [Spiroplasma diminutum CUAS-1]
MNNFNGLNNDNDNDNDNDRTTAFTIQKKQRKVDSVSWIVGALLLFFLNLMALGRITIVGQFLDDVIFNLPFGWFKYFLYILFFIIDFAIYFGIKFKPKKRFIAMIVLTWVVLCWIISSILFIVAYHTKTTDFEIANIWSKTILKDSLNSYLSNWKNNSLWGPDSGTIWMAEPHTYFTTWAGGGLIGTILTGISAYASIYFGLIIAILFFSLDMIWIFTGDAFYFLKPKSKRKGKRLRILSLKNNKNISFNSKQKPKREKRVKSIFNIINIEDDKTFDERDILSSVKESDMTIELPSFNRHNDRNIYEEVNSDFYNDDFSNINLENYNSNQNYKQDYIEPVQSLNRVIDYNLDQVKQEAYYQAETNVKEESTFVPRREIKEVDYEIPLPYESKYGQVSTEQARKELAKETNITPFGANGKTHELFRNKTDKEKKQEDLNGQITLDHFINETKKEKEQAKKLIEDYGDYTSPMQTNLARNILFTSNNYQTRNNYNQTIEIDKNKAIEKEQYVNDSYELPSIDILKKIEMNTKDQEEIKRAANEKAERINETFKQFGVKASVNHMNIGPSVVKFEIQPEPGTKVNSIISLENDLKLALASQNVRIEAPIQGKAAVGIEVPNEKSEVVPMRGVIENTPMIKMSNKLFFAIGKTVTGDLLFGELDKMPHLLVAGSTGSGKSVMINGIISSILMRAKPHEVKFLMIDPKKVELSIYSSIPHLLAPVISDMNLASNALKRVINEMERRYALFTSFGVKNIAGFNAKQTSQSAKLPYFVIIIDELADLMMTSNKKDVEESIMRLTQLSRAAGIHLIVATQRPSTDVITGVIKSNIPVRIAFSVASSIDSRTILDSNGAEKLIGKGDLLYTIPGSTSLVRAQGAYISDEEIEKLVKHCSSQQQQIFEAEFLKEEDETYTVSMGAGNDSMFDEIKNYVIRTQKASTSLIQRKFSIGYNRAARIIDELEESGIIGPQNGSKPREVYIKNEDIY